MNDKQGLRMLQDMARAGGLQKVNSDFVIAWRRDPDGMWKRLREISVDLHYLEQIPSPASDFDLDTASRWWALKEEAMDIYAAQAIAQDVRRKEKEEKLDRRRKRLREDVNFAAQEMQQIADESAISLAKAYNEMQRELSGDFPGGLQFDSLRRRLYKRQRRKKKK